MKKIRVPFVASVMVLALIGCQQASDDSNIMISNDVTNAEAANTDIEAVPPSGAATVAPPDNGNSGSGNALNEADDGGSEDSPPEAGQVIPAQYRGRWGINRADCTSTRGDAKGLILVRDTSIKFYESVAALQEQRPAIATSFSGVFVFNGEGQTWERVMTFTRTGNSLKRAEAGGTYTYARC